MGIAQITQAQVNAHNETKKTEEAEIELGSNAIRIIIETIVPMIQDGSINTAIPVDIITAAKAMRKAEL